MNPDGSRQELYDFEADPQCMELDNLADRYPDEVKRFSKMLREFKASIPQGVPQQGGDQMFIPCLTLTIKRITRTLTKN